jgi:hypothetical protein
MNKEIELKSCREAELPDNIVADRHEITGKWVFHYLTDDQAKICKRALTNMSSEAQLQAENERLRYLVQVLIDNDPNDDAADAVTVLDVWRKEAKAALQHNEGKDAN